MTLGLVLLSRDGFYIDENGMLPKRPKFDKEFVLGMIKGKRVLCSQQTLVDLPKSMTDNAYFTTNVNMPYDINFGIDTFKNKPDILIVTRSSYDLGSGSKFRLDGYTIILVLNNLEVYRAN